LTSDLIGPNGEETMASVVTAVDDAIGMLTLRHGKVNTLSIELIDGICMALDEMRAQAVRVVILRAPKGATVFSAGHDVRELPMNGRDPLTYNDPFRRVVRMIEHYPLPVIAMVEGSVWGGACELVMCCDLITAASDSTFAITPAKLGVPYNLSGILNFMNGADMHFIKEMLFTAQPVSADRLAACGVINYVVPREQLEALTMKLAKQVTEAAPLVQRIMKEELRVLAGAHPLNPEAYERIQALRREVYDSNDYREGILAFLEKRKPVFQGT
jgi:methylmalonyl-CoA decarboxylase